MQLSADASFQSPTVDRRMTTGPCVVVVMAKAPVPGFAKTRLIPALGAQGAAALAQWLLDRTMTAALAAGLGPVELCAAPDTSHAAFNAWSTRPGVRLAAQGDGDLGERMARVFERWFHDATDHATDAATHASPCAATHAASHDAARVLLIGTDAPHLDADVLRAAALALDASDAVFVPAVDGGYALVGLRRPAPVLFTDMPWSTPAVMQRTRERMHACSLTHTELPALHDIDEPADLVQLQGLGWR